MRCGSLTTVGSRAFYYLTNLRKLTLSNNVIKTIDSYAFTFQTISSQKVSVYLNDNQLTEDSFTRHSFSDINRPAEVVITGNKIHCTGSVSSIETKSDHIYGADSGCTLTNFDGISPILIAGIVGVLVLIIVVVIVVVWKKRQSTDAEPSTV